MLRLALVSVLGFGGLLLGGCHGAENCQLKQEVAKLEKENAELRASTAALIKENQALKAEAADDDADDEDDMQLMQPSSAKLNLMEPFSAGANKDPLEAAQDVYVHGHYAEAIKLSKPAISTQPAKAWRLIGASQCFLKNRAGAAEAYSHLDEQGRQFLKYVCNARSNIKL